MIDRKTISLINGEVDGVNSPEESAILGQTLAQSEEARNLLRDLKKLEIGFSSVSRLDPPASLKKSIMRSIEERRVPAKAPAHGFRLMDFLFPARPLPRLGFAFSGGVLAGVVLVVMYFTVVDHPSVDTRDVSGTILGSSEALQTAEDEAISSDGVQGKIVTEYSNSVSVLNADLVMQPDLIARFVFDPNSARLKGVSMANESRGALTQKEGSIEVAHGGGTFRAFFTPSSVSQTVRFQVISAGNIVFARTLLLKKSE
jgi:hypothetical protein